MNRHRSSPMVGHRTVSKGSPFVNGSSTSTFLSPTNSLNPSDFEPEALLAASAYGEVLLANNIKTGKKAVIKKINRLKMNKNLIDNEVAAALTLKHPGIVKVHDVYKEGIYTCLVMEYLKGQDLFKHLSAKSFAPMKEKEARKVFKQLVDIMLYCHTNKFVHRDIKLENIMLDKKKGKVKLIDFGLCERIYEPNQLCDLWCGSQDYVCPEIIKKTPYSGFAADVWSLGTILYITLYGELPFGFDLRVKNLTEGKDHPLLNFPDERNPNTVSDQAKDLIKQMLTVDPTKRITMEAVSKHRWLKAKTLDFFPSW